MACKYWYNGQWYSSYGELTSAITESDLSNLADILFSQAPQKEILYDKIEALNVTSKFGSEKMSMIDGSPDLDHDEHAFTTQTFIDSPLFNINGERPIFQLNTDDYVTTMKTMYVNQKLKTEEEAEAWGEAIQDRWDTIASNALDFHKLILMDSRVSRYEWAQRTKDTAYAPIMDSVIDAENEIFKQVSRHSSRRMGGESAGSLFLKNINITAKIKGGDEEIFGHIDHMAIRSDGEIEIYNVKTSTEPYSQWNKVKKEKYKYQMALIKRMLAYNGIDPKKIRLYIIPVQLKYDDKYDVISEVNVQPAISIDMNDAVYTFQHYDNVAAQFIDSSADFSTIGGETLVKVTNQLQYIFPGKNVGAAGIELTAKEWIDKNWKYLNPRQLPNGEGWEITLPETKNPITVKDTRERSRNEELVNLIAGELSMENSPLSKTTSVGRIKNDIINAYNNGQTFIGADQVGKFAAEQLQKYFQDSYTDANGKTVYNWQLMESPVLDSANVLAFRHRSGQVDVITISSFNPNTKYSFRRQKNLLGAYLMDLNDYNFTLSCNYGNIDAIRTVALLNEALPSIGGDIKLGQLKVIGLGNYGGRQGAFFEFADLLSQWDTIVTVVNKNTSAGIVNNLREMDISCVDPLDGLQQLFNEIVAEVPSINSAELGHIKDFWSKKTAVEVSSSDMFMDSETIEAKIVKLEGLLKTLKNHLSSTQSGSYNIDLSNNRELIALCRSQDKYLAGLVKLYIAASHALARYSGDIAIENEEFSSLAEYTFWATSMPNTYVRRVAFLINKSIDNVRNEILKEFQENAMSIIMDYYEACGYSKAQNEILGNQASNYQNLYQLDENGENTFLFKNPYDPNSDLKPHEREFLKKILYEFHKVRCAMNYEANTLTGINDPKLQANMPPELKNYLYVPLQRAAASTRRANIRNAIVQTYSRVKRAITHPKDAIAELSDYFDAKDTEDRDLLVKHMATYNPYKRTDNSITEREAVIKSKGANYFETNVENIFIDFLAKQVECEEFNKLLIRLKAIELCVTLQGIAENDEKALDHTIKTIDDIVSVSVYHKPIMGATAQKIDMFLAPFRRLVSTVYIACNPVASVRDTIQGLMENFTQALIKYKTNIGAKDVAFGYKQVFEEGCSSLMTMTLLNQFNIKYGFSNFDAAKVAERLKTGRGGVLNPEHWGYWTLRAPDYLNRMTLFIARLHHDGAFNAYSLDENHRLKYEWRKDKRFDVLASGDKSNPKFKEQQSLYYSMIRAFNLQDTKLKLKYTDDLPDAYTPEQIRTIKTLSDSIYGAYDQSARAKYENIAIGRNFMFFSTWMSGLYDSYFQGTQVSQSELKEVQETNYNGEPLYFTADGSGNMTTEDTGTPVKKWAPAMVQGIFNTFSDTFKALQENNWNFKAIKESDIWTNQVRRRNWKRLGADMSIMILLTILFKFYLTPAYQKHKKEGEGKEVFCNVVTEMLYKGSKASWDTFKGPFAIFTYLGEQTNPASYTLQTKVWTDAFNWLSGKRTATQTLMGSQAFFRSAQDSYRMYMRDNQA